MTSNNDCGVREYDLERFQLLNHFRFPWPVNVSFFDISSLHISPCEYLSCNLVIIIIVSLKK